MSHEQRGGGGGVASGASERFWEVLVGGEGASDIVGLLLFGASERSERAIFGDFLFFGGNLGMFWY